MIGLGSGNIWRDKGITYLIQVDDATYTASEFSMAHHKLKPERAKAGPVKVAIKSDKVITLRVECVKRVPIASLSANVL